METSSSHGSAGRRVVLFVSSLLVATVVCVGVCAGGCDGAPKAACSSDDECGTTEEVTSDTSTGGAGWSTWVVVDDADSSSDVAGDASGDESFLSSDDGAPETGLDEQAPGCDSVGCVCLFDDDCARDHYCVENACQIPLLCDDADEPNGDQGTATYLGVIDDDSDPTELVGVLAGTSDEDWYRYQAVDSSFFSSASPVANLAGEGLTYCVYVQCATGAQDTSLECPEHATKSYLPTGEVGCCAAAGDEQTLDLDCDDSSFDIDNATVYMVVLGGDRERCEPYTLMYHF
ncbi:MAG: hypothetical protein JKY37_20065 [Nannocystaceae bacterium]|nr:hypothetical protein [Nannocystaceae bacterium]